MASKWNHGTTILKLLVPSSGHFHELTVSVPGQEITFLHLASELTRAILNVKNVSLIIYKMALHLQSFSAVHILYSRNIIVKISSDHHAYLQKFQWFPMEYSTGRLNREGNKINKDEDNPKINYKYKQRTYLY